MLSGNYHVEENSNSVIIKNIADFNPEHIFECGQCFRWDKQYDSSYTGVVKGKAVNVDYHDGTMTISNSDMKDLKNIWYDYFDLGTDYSTIKKTLAAKDDIMKKAVEFGYGIRILRQDPWETLISFIVSSNNMIPRIKKIVMNMSELYGEEITFKGDVYYSFPGVKSFCGLCEDTLSICKAGFRCRYIIETSKAIVNGNVDLNGLRKESTSDARKKLIGLTGVGNKVADCTLLYSGIKYDVFPTDLWIKRIMEELYFKRETSIKEIQDFSSAYFGRLAGYAQQYLFYYARENRIGAAK